MTLVGFEVIDPEGSIKKFWVTKGYHDGFSKTESAPAYRPTNEGLSVMNEVERLSISLVPQVALPLLLGWFALAFLLTNLL